MRNHSSTRVYLTKAGMSETKEQELQFQKGKTALHFGNFEVKTDSIGSYIDLSYMEEFTDPAIDVPKIRSKHIRKITYRGQIDDNATFRREGVYQHAGAIMTLRNRSRNERIGFGETETVSREAWQDVSISALSFKALREIYTLVRQGELEPKEDWSLQEYQVKLKRQQAKEASEPRASSQVTG